jgi:cobalt-zinc-cadmium efflux system outer membrane protein
MASPRLAFVVGRVLRVSKAAHVCTLLMLLAGCATVDQPAGFSDVRAAVAARSGQLVVWIRGTELDAQVAQDVRTLLHDTLTVDAAVQVALLNNRSVQALYADLGVALDFLEIFYLPLRQRVAAARFADAKLQVTRAVLDFAATAQGAFYRHQANEQRLDLLQTITHVLAASFEVAQRLHSAGNITALDLAQERALFEEAKLHLRTAEVAARQSREHLNTVMGLWVPQTAWHIEPRLPDIPAQPLPSAELETHALCQSLTLASARQRLIAAGEQVGVTRATALIPEASNLATVASTGMACEGDRSL